MSKVWFVTGAGSGIGAATVRAVLKAGDRVVATGRHLDKGRNELSDDAGESLAFFQLDVTNAAQAKASVGEAIKAYGRIDVLDANNARYAANSIEDYVAEGKAEAMWSGYHGTQQGDPARLGDVLVKIAGMDNPPKQFVAGSDAFAVVEPALEARLGELRAYEQLSKSTDGSF